MSDVVTFTEGDGTYRVTGLETKAATIAGASREIDTLIGDRIDAAEAALEQWRGAHAATFSEDVNDVLGKMASLKIALWRARNTLSAFPVPALASFSYIDSVYAGARVAAISEAGTAAAQPGKLRDYVTLASGQDERFATLAGVVNLDGVSAEVTQERPLTEAEIRAAINPWENPDNFAGATGTQTDPVAPSTLITLPTPSADVPALTAASEEVNTFTSAVAIAFEDADQVLLDILAEHPELAPFLLPGMLDGSFDGDDVQVVLEQMSLVEQNPALWQELTPLEQQLLIVSFPSRVGSLDGIPIVARDQANRIVLEETRENLEARLEELRNSENPPQDQITDLEKKLAGIAVIEERLAGVPGLPPAYLVGFSAEGQGLGNGGGRAIVAIGNPDTADNVVTYVPGMGSGLGSVRGDIGNADDMTVDAMKLGTDTSTIMWLGYDAPPALVMPGLHFTGATDSAWAEEGAPALRAFQEGLEVSHQGGDANYTLVGHSYGTTVIGEAASGGDLNADTLVLVASPGVGVDHVSELGIDENRVFVTTAENDRISWTPEGYLGPDPTDPSFGATEFTSGPGSPGGWPPQHNPAHSEYWKPFNPARENIAAIITGNYDQVELAPDFRGAPPPPPDWDE